MRGSSCGDDGDRVRDDGRVRDARRHDGAISRREVSAEGMAATAGVHPAARTPLMRRILLTAAFIVAILYRTIPHRQNIGAQATKFAWRPASAGEVLLPANLAGIAPTAPIQPLPRGAPVKLVLSTHLALLSLAPASDSVEILSAGHGHYYGVAPLLDRWLLVGSQARLAAPARNASRAVLPPERDALLLVDVPARTVVGSWTLPTRYLHDLVAADDGTLFAVDSETADVAEFAAVLLNGSAGEDEARSLPVGPGRRARLAHRRTLRTTTSSVFDSAATAHANNAIAAAGLLWVLHNNLQSTSELHLFELATGAPVRTLLLGGPNCHNPLFYKGELLYLLSSSGGLARLRADGGSTTLWEAGSEWFTKGLAVVDDVAYFGLSRKTRQARDRNFAAMELASFDLVTGRLVRRVPLRVPGLPHERPGLLNAISAPALAPTCSWRACSTTESRESAAAAHDPDARAWLPRRRRKSGRRSSPAAGRRRARRRRRTRRRVRRACVVVPAHPRRRPERRPAAPPHEPLLLRVHGRLTSHLLQPAPRARRGGRRYRVRPHARRARRGAGRGGVDVWRRLPRHQRLLLVPRAGRGDVPAVAPGLRVLAHGRRLRSELQRLGAPRPPRPQPLI